MDMDGEKKISRRFSLWIARPAATGQACSRRAPGKAARRRVVTSERGEQVIERWLEQGGERGQPRMMEVEWPLAIGEILK